MKENRDDIKGDYLLGFDNHLTQNYNGVILIY
jgi:hypothetical protein